MTFAQMLRYLSSTAFVGLSALTLSLPAIAADTVVMTYGVLEASVPVEELTTFAETGEQSSRIKRYIRMSGQEPEEIRQTLTRDVEVDVVVLDTILNNVAGEYVLDQVGSVIHTRSGGANRQAMRSALVLSASDDNQLSLIEVIQNYPTSDVMVDGKRLASAYEQIAELSDRAREWLDLLNLFGQQVRSFWN
jgi:hypothetical protein